MLIQNTGNIVQPWLHIFLYGDTGSGKTTAAATMPSPLLLVPANEGSELTLRHLNVDYMKIGTKDGRPVDAMAHTLEILNDLEARYARWVAGDDTAFPWETIALESMTHYCEMLIASLSSGGQKPMEQQSWGKLAAFFTQVHARLRKLPVHVVFTALAKVKEGKTESVGMPDISGSAAIRLPASCDIIGYCEELPASRGLDNPTYRIHFRKKGAYMARTRFRGIPPYLDNFHFRDIAPICGVPLAE